jgi:hypothetical protein
MDANHSETNPIKIPWWQRFHWPQFLFTLILLGMVSYAMHQIFTYVVPPDNQRLADTVVGYLLGILSSSMAFWNNSTASSDRKTDMLFNSTPTQPTPSTQAKETEENANRTL